MVNCFFRQQIERKGKKSKSSKHRLLPFPVEDGDVVSKIQHHRADPRSSRMIPEACTDLSHPLIN